MHDNDVFSKRVQHPLALLTEIEQRATLESATVNPALTPSAQLLADYAHALNELIVQGRKLGEEPPVLLTFDEGHAGGCG